MDGGVSVEPGAGMNATCRHSKAEWSDTLRCRVCPCGAVLPGKGNKYRAQPVVDQGERFDSTGEHQRWLDLQVMERGGLIHELRRQVRFPLNVCGVKVADYIADAVYQDHGATIVEDFKGVSTQLYRLKKRLMLACHGIEVHEVRAR